MNKYNLNKRNTKEKYYEHEGGYISYNPKTRKEKYTPFRKMSNNQYIYFGYKRLIRVN